MDEYGIIKKMIAAEGIEGIVFDFDGTLFTLEIDWTQLKSHLKRHLQDRYGIQDNFSSLSNTLFQYRQENENIYNDLQTVYHHYELEGYKKGKPNKELINFFKFYKHKKLAIYSMNTQLLIKKFLNDYHLNQICHIIITQENAIEPKPSDEDLNKLSTEWRLPPEKMIFIGNTQADADSGIVAGIKTILI